MCIDGVAIEDDLHVEVERVRATLDGRAAEVGLRKKIRRPGRDVLPRSMTQEACWNETQQPEPPRVGRRRRRWWRRRWRWWRRRWRRVASVRTKRDRDGHGVARIDGRECSVELARDLHPGRKRSRC